MMTYFPLLVCRPKEQRNTGGRHDRNSAPANFMSPATAAGTKPRGRRSLVAQNRKRPSRPKNGLAMSPILPISLLVTVLCVVGAIEGVLDQQLLFIGVAVAATILVCSFEAWSAREAPARSEDERGLGD
jgi:Flp pilus assembly protein TadB